MKKKYFIILIILFHYSELSLAQKIKITWGKESKKELEHYSFVKSDNNNMVKLSLERSYKKITPMLFRYDNKLNELNSEGFKVSEDGVNFDRFFGIKNNLFLFTNTFNKATSITSFYAQPINNITLKADKPNILLDDIKNPPTITSRSKSTYYISRDSSKILLMSEASNDKQEVQRYNLTILNENMDKLWAQKIELPYKAKATEVLSSTVTNEGQVYILLKHYLNDKVKEQRKSNQSTVPAYSIKLLIYDGKSPEKKEFLINVDNKFVHTLKIVEDIQDNVILFGLFQNKAFDVINGFFTVNIDKKNYHVKVANVNNFPAELLKTLDNDGQGDDSKKNPGLSKYYNFVQTVLKENGDRSFILEYSVLVTTSKGGSYLYYGNLLDINLRADGKIAITRIPKSQIGGSRNGSFYLSFFAVPYKDKLLYFYNDDKKNIKKDLSKSAKTINVAKKPSFVLAHVDASGKLERSILQTSRDTDFIVAPFNSIDLSKNKVGLYASKGGALSVKKDMIGIMEIE